MSTIVTRAGKGSPLTNNEVDANFTNLNTDKIETLTSTDGSVIITPTGTTRDLSVGSVASTGNLIAQVRNETGATLTKGTVVYVSGASGNKALVSKALANSDATSAQTYGMIQADIPDNQNGYVVVIGSVSGLDTSAYTNGTQLYLSGTTAGTYTSTKSYAPTHLVYVGIVTYSHANQGTIQVKVQNGYEMDEIHNVSAQSPTNGQTLVYNSSNSLWEASNTFTSAKVITDNSSSSALRITQTGSGNALLVEDEANPDSTPFVVTTDGRVVSGTTVAYSANTISPKYQSHTTSVFDGGFGGASWEANSNPQVTWFAKSRSGTIGTQTIVQANDVLGRFSYFGSDGTSFIEAVRIQAAVDGTPGTNDMPGRLVFSTTADGASSSTERMRIDSAGQVGIGGTPSAGQNLYLAKNITGATTAQGIRIGSVVQSDVTTEARGAISLLGTAASAFTLGTLNQFYAGQGTIGAGSTVSSQIGFYAASSLTGATNNYGFYGGIASGTGRYNLYMAGTADNYLAGSLGIGGVGNADTKINIGGTLPSSSTNSKAVFAQYTIPSTSTGQTVSYLSSPSTQATAFTAAQIMHFYANQGTIGAGSTVTSQFGFYAGSVLTGATNNYGFYGGIASGTGRWNLYMAGTASNYFGGKTYQATNQELFIGGTTDATTPSLLSDGTYLQINAPAGSADIRFRVAGSEAARITSTGKLLIGSSTSYNTVYGASQFGPGFQSYNTVGTGGFYRYSADTDGSALILSKSRGASVGTQTAVVSSDTLGYLGFTGSDGTNFVTGATITAQVDGTPATASMPSRLSFSTTADGSNTPTERMRITSTGAVGIGATPAGDRTLLLSKQITGATTAYGLVQNGSIQSDVTTAVQIYRSGPSTAASAFTLGSLSHYVATTPSIGAGSTVTNQFGYVAESSLTGATNNYGFYGNIASGTGRYNLYMNGTADNYMAGSLGIGALPLAGINFYLSKTLTGATSAYGFVQNATVQSDVTGVAQLVATGAYTQAATFTLSDLRHYSASQGTFGAGSTVTSQYGFIATGSLIGATNNFGFYSTIASGTGRYNFYAAGTAANVFVGTTSLGGTQGAESLRVTPIASAVNYAEIIGNITGFGPVLKASGSDTNIYLGIQAKGNAPIYYAADNHWFNNQAGNTQLRLSNAASAVNYVQIQNATTANSPLVFANGTDTNVPLALSSKGTGGIAMYSGIGATLQFNVSHTASAVNYLNVTGGSTGNAVIFSAQGTDTNIWVNYQTKGTGTHQFLTANGGAPQFTISHTASAVNRINVTGSTTGSGVTLSAQGSDTDIDLRLAPKGTGSVQELVGSTAYNIVNQSDIGSAANKIPLNQYLGTMAFQDANAISVGTAFLGMGVEGRQVEVSGATTAGKYTLLSRETTSNTQLIGAAGTANLGLYSTGGGDIWFYTATGLNEPQFKVTRTASTVNYIQVAGAATSGAPYVLVNGSDTNIPLILSSKGTGSIQFKTAGATPTQFLVAHTASAVNYLQATGSATGSGATLSAQGSDTNVQINILAKGAGGVSIGSYSGKGGLFVSAPSTGVNYVQADGANTGTAPTVSAQGSDTNIDLNLTPKGTGKVNVATRIDYKVAGVTSEYSNGNAGASKTVTWSNGSKQSITLDQNTTLSFSFTSCPVGNYQLKVVQDATGGRTITWSTDTPGSTKWIGVTGSPSLNSAASSITFIGVYWDGTNAYGSAGRVNAL